LLQRRATLTGKTANLSRQICHFVSEMSWGYPEIVALAQTLRATGCARQIMQAIARRLRHKICCDLAALDSRIVVIAPKPRTATVFHDADFWNR
jgi:hypothetical protein